MLTEPTDQFDQVLVVAREKLRITELSRLVTQTREVFRDVAPRRVADGHSNGQRSWLRKQAGSWVECSRAKSRKGEKMAAIHRRHSITGSREEAKPTLQLSLTPQSNVHLYERYYRKRCSLIRPLIRTADTVMPAQVVFVKDRPQQPQSQRQGREQ